MEEITNIDALNSLVLPYFKRGVITNNFLRPEDYDLFFKEKSLFYEKTENVLLLFRKVNYIYNVYFYINGDGCINFPENCVVEIVDPDKKIIDFLGKSGVSEVKVRREMKLTSFDKLISETKVSSACDNDINEIIKIIKDNFNDVYGRIPSLEELRNDKIFIAKDEMGNIEGLVHFKIFNSYSQISHVVSLKSGIGKKVVSGYINQEKDNFHEFRVWVNSDNDRAINLYLKIGYEFTGRKSVVYSNINR